MKKNYSLSILILLLISSSVYGQHAEKPINNALGTEEIFGLLEMPFLHFLLGVF